MRFTHIDVNLDITYQDHQNWSKICSMNILSVFGHHHMWRQNWRQYVWTPSCQFILFVNLLHSQGVWSFDIWYLFDNLTSFDILTHYSSITHVPHHPCPLSRSMHYNVHLTIAYVGGWAHGQWASRVMGQIGIIIYRWRWGTWVMG